MPIRRVSQRSDRGSLKELARPHEIDVTHSELPPTAPELRYKKLYEYATTYKDTKLSQALGVITTDYIADKNALPLSIYRIKKVVEDIKSRSGHEIEKLEQQFTGHLSDPISPELIDYLFKHKKIKKTAAARQPPVFRRVSVE